MRRPRQLKPGTRWSVTVRCQRAQFRLRPDTSREHAFGVFLGRAHKAFPGIRLFAACQMSNHMHLVLEDQHGQLDRFMALVLSPLAKALNAIDGVRGVVWERRYSGIPILDEGALVDRIVYTLMNPVAAQLVRTPEAWPGVLLGPGFSEAGRYVRFRKRQYESARRAGSDVEMEAFEEWVDVAIDASEPIRAEVKRELGRRLEALPKTRKVLGVDNVLAQKVFEAPKQPKWGPAPIYHTTCTHTWWAFLDTWKAFLAEYRAASQAFRSGLLNAGFPDWSFRPSVPILAL